MKSRHDPNSTRIASGGPERDVAGCGRQFVTGISIPECVVAAATQRAGSHPRPPTVRRALIQRSAA